jgi:hypothetical protein
MKYQKPINIWNVVPASRIKDIQAGQWVYAGDKADKGIFLGVKTSGVIVCAWYRNAKNSQDFKGYVKALRQYALAV